MEILNMVISIVALIVSYYVFTRLDNYEEENDELKKRIKDLENKPDKFKEYRGPDGLLGGKK